MSTRKFRAGCPARAGTRRDRLAQPARRRYDAGRMDETATARVTGVAQVFGLHALKAFAPDKRVRKMLFKTDQLWSEIAGEEVIVPTGSIVGFPNAVPHDVRNLGPERCVIMFLKVNPKVLKG